MADAGGTEVLTIDTFTKTVRLWRLKLEELIEMARCPAGRELTAEERSVYLAP